MPSKLELTITSLDVLVPVAEGVPILGAPVKGSLEATKKILEYAQCVRTNKEDTKDLAEQAAHWARDIVNAVQAVRDDLDKLRSLESSVLDVLKVLEEIASFQRKRANQSTFMASFRKQDDAGMIVKLRNDLRTAYERFTTAALIRIEAAGARAEVALARTEVAMARTEAAVQQMASKADIENMRKMLSPVFSARFDARDAPPGCMEDTRVEVLAAIRKWVYDTQTNLSVYWLSGMAGTGKTTIAKTLCETLSKDGLLASSFFVSRQSAIRRDPFNIIRTMAYDFTRLDGTIQDAMCCLVQDRPDLFDRPMEEQIQILLVDPLTRLFALRSPPTAFVIVVDALDECTNNADTKQFLDCLNSSLANLPIKLLITSRNEKYIRLAFDAFLHDSLKLHDLEQSIVSTDLSHFFESSLKEVARDRHVPRDWPSTEDIERLTQLTGYLFIYAATIIKYIQHSRFAPDEQLKRIFSVAGSASSGSEIPELRRVDDLYSHILTVATTDDEGRPDDRLIRRIQRLLSTLVTAEEPLTLRTLAGLLDESESETLTDCEALTAVLRIPENDQWNFEHIVVLHPSFPDFLHDSKRCGGDSPFLVNDGIEQALLSSRCLELIGRLKPDICNAKDPNIRACDLSDKAEEHILTEVRYACVHWGSHVSRSTPREGLVEQMLDFCKLVMLPWIESLSSLDSLSTGLTTLSVVHAWCQHLVPLYASDLLVTFLNEGSRFLKTFFTPIHAYPLHCYTSVVFMPRCNLYEHLSCQASSVTRVELISCQEDNWSRREQVFEGHGAQCSSAAFSADDQHIISGSIDHTVRVWNAKTAIPKLVLKGHTSIVTSICVCQDLVFSGSSDRTIHIWDFKTGAPLQILEGHSNTVCAVDVAKDGSLLLSASHDETVRVWTHKNASFRESAIMHGHNGPVWCVSLSYDSNLAVSGSDNHSLILWDVRTYQEKRRFNGDNKAVLSVAFSPDNTRIASGSSDHTIRLWDIQSGQQVRVFSGHTVAFSPDGSRIASGADDNTIRVWKTETGKITSIFRGHTDGVRSVAFSHDGRYIASASNDRTIQTWPTDSQGVPVPTSALEGCSRSVSDVAVSSDGTLACTASEDGNARLWNLIDGRMVGILEGHSEGLTCVQFPCYDCSMVATGSENGIIGLWNTATKQLEKSFKSQEGKVRQIRFVPDGSRLASLSRFFPNATSIWDVASGNLIYTKQNAAFDFAFSHAGRILATGHDSYPALRMWNASDGKPLTEVQGVQEDDNCVVSSITFTPDDTQVAYITAYGKVCIHETSTGILLARLQVGTVAKEPEVFNIKFGPDGAYLAAQCPDGQTCFWDMSTHTTYPTSGGRKDAHIFTINQSGWILHSQPGYKQRQVCWVPLERRWDHRADGRVINFAGTRVIISGSTGIITVLECGPIISLFEELDA